MTYNWSNYKTLVAEDDPLNFKYIELLLTRRTGITTIWAKDGLEAINMSRENKGIDIVLLDLQLPKLDGLGALKSIKEFNPYLPIIIQTANSWNNEEETCYSAGCDGFFNKPLNIDQLLISMDECMRMYSTFRHSNILS
jgi:two-component system cell cycle response regulator DivK